MNPLLMNMLCFIGCVAAYVISVLILTDFVFILRGEDVLDSNEATILSTICFVQFLIFFAGLSIYFSNLMFK